MPETIRTPTTSTPARRFLLVHGVQHRRPRQHWLWWLTETLRRRGEQVLYPQFPAPERPSVNEWVDLLHAELAQLGDGQRVVVCHSLGCALWLRAAQTLPPELRVTRVLLVSPLGEQAFTADNGNEEFALARVDPDLLAAASTEPPRGIISATDPYAPADPQAWSATLGLDHDVLPAAGHITPADGYGPWPGVLDWCLTGRTPVLPTVAVAVAEPPRRHDDATSSTPPFSVTSVEQPETNSDPGVSIRAATAVCRRLGPSG